MQEKAVGDLTAVRSLPRSLTIQTLFRGHSKSSNRRKCQCWQDCVRFLLQTLHMWQSMALVERWI